MASGLAFFKKLNNIFIFTYFKTAVLFKYGDYNFNCFKTYFSLLF